MFGKIMMVIVLLFVVILNYILIFKPNDTLTSSTDTRKFNMTCEDKVMNTGKAVIPYTTCTKHFKDWCMNIKYGDTISYKGFIGEVVSVTDNKVTVHYGGDALHYFIEEYELTDSNIIVINTNEGV